MPRLAPFGLAVALGLLALGCGKKPAPAPELEGAEPPAPRAKSDAELLQGTWKIESLAAGGQPESAESFTTRRLVFHGDKFTMRSPARSLTNSFTLDATKKPKAVDLHSSNNPNEPGRGIYELAGDRLKLCVVFDPKAERPTAFESKTDPSAVLWVLVRDTSAPPLVVNADPAAVAKAKRDTETLQGVWRFESGVLDGRAMSVPTTILALVFRDNRITTIQRGGAPNPEVRSFEIDATTSPAMLSISNLLDASLREYSTYELSGDRLKLGFAGGTSDPPTAFESKPGSQTMVWVLVRDKKAPSPAAATDPAAFPKSIIGTWKFKRGESRFGMLVSDSEFTADGRVRQMSGPKGEWADQFTYRFDKDMLVLAEPKKGDKGGYEVRVKVARISFDEFVAVDPKCELRRIK